MKKFLILLAVLAIAATPAMASTKLEAGQKHAVKHHAAAKHEKKHLKKKTEKKLAKHSGKKQHKAVV